MINAFANNMSTDIKLSIAKLSKMIQLGGFFRGMLISFDKVGKVLGKKKITDLAIPLARENLPGLISNLASNATLNVIDRFRRKISEKRPVIAEKGFTLFILNEDINDIIRIIKSLEDSSVLIDGVTETVKDEKKSRKQICWYIVSTFSCFISGTSDFCQ